MRRGQRRLPRGNEDMTDEERDALLLEIRERLDRIEGRQARRAG